jgi:hypothetical protein
LKIHTQPKFYLPRLYYIIIFFGKLGWQETTKDRKEGKAWILGHIDEQVRAEAALHGFTASGGGIEVIDREIFYAMSTTSQKTMLSVHIKPEQHFCYRRKDKSAGSVRCEELEYCPNLRNTPRPLLQTGF